MLKQLFKITTLFSFPIFSFSQQENNATNCEENRKQITILQNDIKKALNSCDVNKAKNLVNEINDKYPNCISIFQQDTQNDILIDIMIKEKSNQQFESLKANFVIALNSNKCKDGDDILKRMKNELKCSTSEIQEYLKLQEKLLRECFDNDNVLKLKAEVEKQMENTKNLSFYAIEKSLIEIDSKLTTLKKSNLSTQEISKLERKRSELEDYRQEEEKKDKKLTRKNQMTQFSKITKPELLIGLSTLIPIFYPKVDITNINKPSYYHSKNNLSYGIGLRVFNRNKASGFRLLAKYESFELEFIDIENKKNDFFKVNSANIELKKTWDNQKAYHPIFLTYGIGGSIPISVKYSNQNNEVSISKNFGKSQHLEYSIYSLLGIGTGFEGKKLGILLEANVKLGGFLSPFILEKNLQSINYEYFNILNCGTSISMYLRPF